MGIQRQLDIQKEVDTLNLRSWEAYHIDNDKSYQLCQEAEKLAEAYGYQKGIYDSHINKAWYFSTIPDYCKSLSLFLTLVDPYKAIQDCDGILKSYAGISGNNFYLGNYHTCLHWNHKAFLLASETENKERQLSVITSNAQVYNEIGPLDKAIKFSFWGLQMAKKHFPNSNILIILSKTIASAYLKQDKPDRARPYIEYALNSAKEIQNKHLIWESLCLYGQYYALRGRYHEAELYFLKAVDISKNGAEQEVALYNTSLFYYTIKEFSSAVKYGKAAYIIAKKLNSKTYIEKAIDLVLEIYSSWSNYRRNVRI